MGRYRKVDPRMWGDSKFNKLTPIPPCGQGLWLRFLTGEQTTSVPGLFCIGEAGMAEALGWDLLEFRRVFDELAKLEMTEADWKARVISIPNAIKYNCPESPYVVLAWKLVIDEIPECDLKERHLKHIEKYFRSQEFVDNVGKNRPQRNREPYIEALAWARGKALRKPNFRKDSPSSSGSTNTSNENDVTRIKEQEQEQEQEQVLKEKKKTVLSKPQIKNLSEKEIQAKIGICLGRYKTEQFKSLRSAMGIIKSMHKEPEFTKALRLSILLELEKYPPGLVVESCEVYVKKERKPSMREDYLISIVKNKAKNLEFKQIKETRKNSIDPDTHWMDSFGERIWPRREIEIQSDKIRQQLENGIKTDPDMVDTLKRCGKERPEWGIEVST